MYPYVHVCVARVYTRIACWRSKLLAFSLMRREPRSLLPPSLLLYSMIRTGYKEFVSHGVCTRNSRICLRPLGYSHSFVAVNLQGSNSPSGPWPWQACRGHWAHCEQPRWRALLPAVPSGLPVPGQPLSGPRLMTLSASRPAPEASGRIGGPGRAASRRVLAPLGMPLTSVRGHANLAPCRPCLARFSSWGSGQGGGWAP